MKTKENILIKSIIAMVMSLIVVYIGFFAIPNKNIIGMISGCVVSFVLTILFLVNENKQYSKKDVVKHFIGFFLSSLLLIILISLISGGIALIVYTIVKENRTIIYS